MYLKTSDLFKVSQGLYDGFTRQRGLFFYISDTGIPKTFKYNVRYTGPRFFCIPAIEGRTAIKLRPARNRDMIMKKMLLLVMCALSLNVFAQKIVKWSFSIGGAFPMGDFASMSYDNNTLISDCVLFDEGKKCGGAAGGFNLGSEILVPLKKDNIDFTIAFDLHLNGLNNNVNSYLGNIAQDLADYSAQQFYNAGASQVKSECSINSRPVYVNMPLLAGARYTIPASSEISFYVEGGVGYNFISISPCKITLKNDLVYNGIMYNSTTNMALSYSTNGSVAFRLGAGLNLGNCISFSAYYYYLGSSDVSVQSSVESDGNTQNQNYQGGTINPMMFVLKLGFTL